MNKKIQKDTIPEIKEAEQNKIKEAIHRKLTRSIKDEQSIKDFYDRIII